MAVVKGSVQHELVIVKRAPGFRLWRFFWLLALIAGTAAGGYFYGYYDSRMQVRNLTTERDFLAGSLRKSEQTIDDLTQRVAILEKGGEVDRRAAEDFRETVRQLSDEVARLEQDVAFYKGIMAPGSGDKGLRVSKIDILPAERSDQYNYSVMLTQVVDNTSYIQGQAAINIVGVRDGEKVVVPLRDLDPTIEGLGVVFRFRYFQEIKGTLTVPANFIPEQMQVVLQSQGSNSQRVEETRLWTSEGEA
ncbi:DUF6776 family protein [Thalassolituus sp.]|jgi:hypothetical protein|uniref:DUF6776 family protein n=1 Tax=Thalassolituus sp. TaxID=2030822 RepID=UPI00261003AD|nr:DUF6776 family protein [uncultured Thalassolituus sp.]TNC91939.1 MAG: hypothetical protein CSH36_07105 [Thalassolituus sp.]